jgi:hypothetical protein
MFTPGHTPGCISMLYKPSKVDSCRHIAHRCMLFIIQFINLQGAKVMVLFMAGTVHRRPSYVLGTIRPPQHCQVPYIESAMPNRHWARCYVLLQCP